MRIRKALCLCEIKMEIKYNIPYFTGGLFILSPLCCTLSDRNVFFSQLPVQQTSKTRVFLFSKSLFFHPLPFFCLLTFDPYFIAFLLFIFFNTAQEV